MTRKASHHKPAVHGEASFGRGFVAFLIFLFFFSATGFPPVVLPGAFTFGCIFGSANSGRNAALIFRGMIYATAFGIVEMGLLYAMRNLSPYMREQFPFDAACALALIAYGVAVASLSEKSERSFTQAALVCVSAAMVAALMAFVGGCLGIDIGAGLGGLLFTMSGIVAWVPALVGWSFAEYMLKGAPFPGRP